MIERRGGAMLYEFIHLLDTSFAKYWERKFSKTRRETLFDRLHLLASLLHAN
jgi:hypothetical protein